MPHLDETDILRQLSEPKTRAQAFSLIVSQYSEQIYWKIRSIVISHDNADDILQNTFLKAWKSIADFHGKSTIYTWLFRIAINESLDYVRKKRQMGKYTGDYDNGVAQSLLADEYFDGTKSQALLQEAISLLPEVQRTVFSLRYYDEMKYSEISKLLNTTEGALKASYHIAVKKISDYIRSKTY